MKKNLSWKFLLGVGAGCWILAKLIGGVIGDVIGLLAGILIALGLVNFFIHLAKKKKDGQAPN